jgi:hypothetical protein
MYIFIENEILHVFDFIMMCLDSNIIRLRKARQLK